MEQMKGRNVRVREGQWHYRLSFRGREYSGPTGLDGAASNRIAAEQFAERKRAEIVAARPTLTPTRAPAIALDSGFRGAADAFLKWARDVEYRSKPNTAERIRVSFTSLNDFFGEVPLRQVDAPAIERFKTNRAAIDGVRDVTIRHDLHALSVFYQKYALKHRLVSVNPLEEVTIPSDRDAVREHVISAEEEAAYFAAAAELHAHYAKSFPKSLPNLADLARLMLEQGCRPEELLASLREHFDPLARTLKIAGGKTRAARRTLHLTAASLEILSRRHQTMPESTWLFPSDRHPGRHLTKLANSHDRVCVEAEVSFRLYDFRHTFATRAIEAGVPVAVVAAILGHSGLRTIHRYVHPSESAQKDAMALVEAAARQRKLG